MKCSICNSPHDVDGTFLEATDVCQVCGLATCYECWHMRRADTLAKDLSLSRGDSSTICGAVHCMRVSTAAYLLKGDYA